MKIRIQNSEEFLDVDIEHPYLLGDTKFFEQNIKPQLQEIIEKNNLKCNGCGKPLTPNNWMSVQHRPMSAGGFQEKMTLEDKENVLHYVEYELKDIWAIFLFCYDTRAKCIKKWTKKRPK